MRAQEISQINSFGDRLGGAGSGHGGFLTNRSFGDVAQRSDNVPEREDNHRERQGHVQVEPGVQEMMQTALAEELAALVTNALKLAERKMKRLRQAKALLRKQRIG